MDEGEGAGEPTGRGDAKESGAFVDALDDVARAFGLVDLLQIVQRPMQSLVMPIDQVETHLQIVHLRLEQLGHRRELRRPVDRSFPRLARRSLRADGFFARPQWIVVGIVIVFAHFQGLLLRQFQGVHPAMLVVLVRGAQMNDRRAIGDDEMTTLFRGEMSGLQVDRAPTGVHHLVLRTVVGENASLKDEPTLLIAFQILKKKMSEEKRRTSPTFVHLYSQPRISSLPLATEGVVDCMCCEWAECIGGGTMPVARLDELGADCMFCPDVD